MNLTVGARLGPYEILELLGQGGMGEVWKARDTRLDRLVAIKRLTAHSDRFEQEARAIAALNHPHICQIHDVGPDYLVLEYIDGQPLQGPLPVNEALRLALQIASALEAAHSKGIFHRDLKPANVMVTQRSGRSSDPPTAKLLDFGLAKLVSADAEATRTVDGTVLGTAAYMSPEQAEGKPLDARSDIFSFGAVLYEMLSGTRAFPGTSMVEVLSAVIRAEPPPMQAPAALERIVRRCLQKQTGQRFQTIGEVRAALEHASREFATKPAEQQPSIAVLPFANMSGDKENEYFSDGLAEEIINALAQIPDLKVIARTSAFAFKDKQEDVRRIAEALGVANILEGSVRRAGNRVRVTAQLITAADGSHLWSNRYDREMADVFVIQDEIAQAIAGALQVKLAVKPTARHRYVPIVPAYEAYLKALYYWARATPDGMARHRECLEQAIALDPGFALAQSRLGYHFFMMYVSGLQPAHEAVPLVRTRVQRALEIDPSLPEAHAAMGCLAAMYDYDWTEADRRFDLAFARDLVAPLEVRTNRANFFLAHVGRAREAVEDLERALTEDPVNLFTRWTLAVCLRAAGRDEEADARYREVVEFDQGILSTYAAIVLSGNHVARGQIREALTFAETAYARDPWHPAAIGQLGGMLARTGDGARAKGLVDQLLPGEAFGTPFGLALHYLASDDLDTTADWLEKAIAQRDIWVPFLLRVGNIGGRVVWSSPRWPKLARMMNLPQ